jgi:hypothetical protein
LRLARPRVVPRHLGGQFVTEVRRQAPRIAAHVGRTFADLRETAAPEVPSA